LGWGRHCIFYYRFSKKTPRIKVVARKLYHRKIREVSYSNVLHAMGKGWDNRLNEMRA
jgi:hypothetical protein